MYFINILFEYKVNFLLYKYKWETRLRLVCEPFEVNNIKYIYMLKTKSHSITQN